MLLQEDETQNSATMINLEKKESSKYETFPNQTMIDVEKKESSATMINNIIEKKEKNKKNKESSATTVINIEKKELSPLSQKLMEASRSRWQQSKDDDGKVDATELVDYSHCHWKYDSIYTIDLCILCTERHPPQEEGAAAEEAAGCRLLAP